MDGDELPGVSGLAIRVWAYVDYGNLYGDESARAILGKWWSGEGPSPASWRFDVKGEAGDAVGRSFAVHVPNDPGRDRLLYAFVANASAQRPTKVFLTGRISTFDAPANLATLTGLQMQLRSSRDILLERPERN